MMKDPWTVRIVVNDAWNTSYRWHAGKPDAGWKEKPFQFEGRYSGSSFKIHPREHLMHMALARLPSGTPSPLGYNTPLHWVTMAGGQAGDLRGVTVLPAVRGAVPVVAELKKLSAHDKGKSRPFGAGGVSSAFGQALAGLHEFLLEFCNGNEEVCLPTITRFASSPTAACLVLFVDGEIEAPALNDGLERTRLWLEGTKDPPDKFYPSKKKDKEKWDQRCRSRHDRVQDILRAMTDGLTIRIIEMTRHVGVAGQSALCFRNLYDETVKNPILQRYQPSVGRTG